MTRRVSFVLVAGLVLSLALGAAPVAAAPAGADSKQPLFGPFDAGASRQVTRQGSTGKLRRAHPAVGAADKVPGEGPPPPPLRVDPDIPETALDGANVVGAALSSNPLYLAALVYSNLLTKVDGPRCQHMPTCSRFANQAVARHGVVGILMGLDRVIAPPQSSALRLLPDIQVHGEVRHFDPVENHEFWKAERFTGFPPKTDEEPLVLYPLPAPDAAASAEGTP